MPSASVTARKTKRGGRRYAVRFRLGGRAYPVERGGSLRALAEQPQRQGAHGKDVEGQVPRLTPGHRREHDQELSNGAQEGL
jgi:hypothetical protein